MRVSVSMSMRHRHSMGRDRDRDADTDKSIDADTGMCPKIQTVKIMKVRVGVEMKDISLVMSTSMTVGE